jgi:hypothetical protein
MVLIQEKTMEMENALKLFFENFPTLNLFPPLNQIRLTFPHLTFRFLVGAEKKLERP